MAGRTHAFTVNVVAFEALQFLENVTECPYLGATSGINSNVTNNFLTPLKATGGDISSIHNCLQSLGNNIQSEIGYLTRHSIYSLANSQDLNFINCYRALINGIGANYIPDIGRYTDNILYTPIAKFFTMAIGTGTTPSCVSSTKIPFSAYAPVGTGPDATLLLDGKDLLLVVRGAYEGDVTIHPSVGNGRFYFNRVNRASLGSYAHNDNGIAGLQITHNNILGPLSTDGVFDFSRRVEYSGKPSDTILRFSGELRQDSCKQQWLSAYGDDDFDMNIY